MRPELLNPVFAEASSLKGVGATLGRALKRLQLNRMVDLLFHLPVGRIERLPVATVGSELLGRVIIVPLTVLRHELGSGSRPSRFLCADDAGQTVSLVYFGQAGHYGRKLLPVGARRLVSGRLESYGPQLQIAHPDHVLDGEAADGVPAVEPLYALAEGLTNKRAQQLIAQALERAPGLPEWIEPSILAQRQWPGWRQALARAHLDPADSPARDRLAYDELLAQQLALLLVRQSAKRRRGRSLRGDGRLLQPLLGRLPWPLTGAQRRAIGEITGDLAQASPMLRLLQGDVGSGKTLVALAAMLTAVESGAQAAMLAPTELLARQHGATLGRILGEPGPRIAILTGRDKGRARERLLEDLAAGTIEMLVGTHAIFQEDVVYRDLGLVVIDEQHRFGVEQRLALARKAERPPHLLAMTATPIPRTLALTLYGEMDVTRLDELPPGRQPIDTRVVSVERLEEVTEALARHVDGGQQAYWVCPLVSESETSDTTAAVLRAAELRVRLGDRVGLVHGRMAAEERDLVMAAFQAGDIGVLVATTVIEVGVDVPAATLMVVEQAERFGLAQLHQLRGRVGRGTGRSTCLLLRSSELSETARARLALLRETNDGFRIAEEDLRLRGAGEILGVRQSGEHRFRLADAAQVATLLPPARDDARLLLERDGGLDSPRGAAARLLLYLFERDAAVSLLRSG